MCALHGMFYLLQSEGGGSSSSSSRVSEEEIRHSVLPMATDYLHTYLQDTTSPVGQCEQHAAAVWALAFYVLENFEHEVQVS